MTDAVERVTLVECPIGLFWYGDTLCLKTEYGNNEGRIDAYIVESGEFYWGDPPQTIASQRAQLVTPIDTDAALLALAAPLEKDAEWPADALFQMGDFVSKKGRTSWRGKVVGWYRTDLTALGFAVESIFEPGTVQIYPQTALEAADRLATLTGPGWQDIETAPKDDTMFLACCADGRMMIWSGRIFALQDERTPDHLRFPATDWMPLPKPPAMQSSSPPPKEAK